MDFPVNPRDLVVKIKYGDALRRFTAHVNGDSLDHNMSSLRTKTINLFQLRADADLVFTYMDIDGDVVTLLTDEELHDAVICQCLNPLRITVHVKSNASSDSSANSTNTNSPFSAIPGFEFLPPQVSHAIGESLQAVPEPIRQTLTKISEEVSKVAATVPVATELADFFAKLGHPVFAPGSASASRKHTNNSRNPSAPDLLSDLNMPSTVNFPDLNLVFEQPKNGKLLDDGKLSAIASGSSLLFLMVILMIKLPRSFLEEGEVVQKEDSRDKGKSVDATSFVPPIVPQQNSDTSSVHKVNVPGGDYCSNKNQLEGNISASRFCDKIENGFAAIQRNDSATPVGYRYRRWSDFCRRGPSGFQDGVQAFHRGVSCDGCGMHPIVGPRYKSKVQENFDLCNICFSDIGNETDYIRIDRPARQCRGFFGPNAPHHPFRMGMRPPKEKLESRFIKDVTILDGTLIAPSTEFTKIWKIRNSGSTTWPNGTHLVWIGGDVFADKSSVDLEIPLSGFPPSQEIDVAVDFRSPSMPGRYISYWRLASPQGQKFGQRVWVLIQVYAIGSTGSGFGSFDFTWTGNEVAANLQPVIDIPYSSPDPPVADADSVRPLSAGTSGGKDGLTELLADDPSPPAENWPVMSGIGFLPHHPVTGSTTVSSNSVEQPVPAGQPFVPYPFLDMLPIPKSVQSEAAPASCPPMDSVLSKPSSSVSSTAVFGVPFNEAIEQDLLREQALLRELEDIGFKEVEINKGILRQNEYDLEKSVDDLCSIADWDPLLGDLEEMGFHDKEANIKLLAKNGGSLKRTVLDLVSGNKV